MDNLPFDQYDRSQLAEFLGKSACFMGTVVNVKSPTPTTKFACLRNVRITHRDDSVRFKDRPYVTCDHIWIDISSIDPSITRITDTVVGMCTVYEYSRKDGTKSFCLRFKEKGMTDGTLLKRFFERIVELRKTSEMLTLDQQHKLINSLIDKTEELAMSGNICFFDETQEDFLKTLRKHRGRIKQAAGVFLPCNRAARRYRREQGVSRHRVQQPKATGFR